MYIHPTLELNHPDIYGLVMQPTDWIHTNENLRFVQHSLADLVKLHGAFNGNDWQEPKLGGDISTGRVFELLAAHDLVCTNMVPWGFFYLPVVTDPTGIYFEVAYVGPTSKDDYDAMDWISQAHYIAIVHVLNDQFILRLRHEVEVLTGLHQYGRPKTRNP